MRSPKKISKRILVIAPHLDDEVLGCGGAIAKHAAEGNEVHVCFIANRVYQHRYDENIMKKEIQNAERAKKILGYHRYDFLNLPDERLDESIQRILIPLEQVVDKIKPEIVYSPFPGDNHQDHQAVARAVQIVLRPAATSFVKRWLLCETISSTEQAPPIGEVFRPNYYQNIEAFMQAKIRALRCYEREKRSFPHPRSEEGVRALAVKRGVEAGMGCAEAFMLMRERVL